MFSHLFLYQYSGAVHDVIPGIVMVNLLHYNTKTDQSTPVDYRIYDKETEESVATLSDTYR
ncbi:MAG: hypothetical protein O7D30_03335 [Rickettsia endosymbiont of Ixodes persulcatus]|nr:hypothetical protein [Rickettsia endosymbiont of Ixodes persulcatus]MCZ6924501.1 hypothetical protein [Rickettsia endosymbiont of Ixodes persulcatus]